MAMKIPVAVWWCGRITTSPQGVTTHKTERLVSRWALFVWCRLPSLHWRLRFREA